MAALASASNAGLLAVINHAAEHIKDVDMQFFHVLIYGLVLSLYIYSQRYVLLATCDEVEDIVHQIRCRMVKTLQSCELAMLEHSGHGRIYSAICNDTQTLSQAACTIVLGFQSVILIVFASLYIAWLSIMSLLLIIAVMAGATLVYWAKMKSVHAMLHQANEQESRLHDQIGSMLSGFKEVKLSSRRAGALIDDVEATSQITAQLRKVAQRGISVNFMFAQIALFLVLGSMVFVLPVFSPAYTDTVMKTLTAVLFLVGPISGIIAAIPQIATATAAVENLLELERSLVKHAQAKQADAASDAPAAFRSLELKDIHFRHERSDGQGFAVGPINLSVRAGEIIFITGGNGSGKSTLIKLLTALYPPASGSLLLNGRAVAAERAQTYRDQICAVFSDFHLFDKLYGLEDWSHQEAERLLDEMEIADKAEMGEYGFNTLDLSTGQRKRLALIAAMLEHKPLCVLDEWAADQDPHFRRKFYETLVPSLRERGMTLIAVTHDDRYFHLADRRLHMEDGCLYELGEESHHA
ncbi:cyclic peptide export ABC transporter [Chromobacterium sp. ATCC 53434]